MSRHAILVLGMHRSRTSLLAGLLGHAGLVLPEDTMPATMDNPRGYWESRGIAKFNNRLLQSAGTRWNDDAAIDPGWFADKAREADQEEALALLDASFGNADQFVLKDPRLCRLLPFWTKVLSAADINHSAVMVLRDPLEVSLSLAARKDCPESRPAAIVAISRSLLLWLRYVLDAERHSRGITRIAIGSERLVTEPVAILEQVHGIAKTYFVQAKELYEGSGVGAIDAGLYRQRALDEPGEPRIADGLECLRRLRGQLIAASGGSCDAVSRVCDDMTTALNRLVHLHAPQRRDADPLEERDIWSDLILDQLSMVDAAPVFLQPKQRRILFLSGAPDSVGHVYRVEHPVEALTERGWVASWLPIGHGEVESRSSNADAVVVFRVPMNPVFDAVRALCRQIGTPLIYDIDDLLFDPEIMLEGHFAYLHDIPVEERLRWISNAVLFREALASCDEATVTTAPLAVAARRHCSHVAVLPNCLPPRLALCADAARAIVKPSSVDGRVRFGFASGTPTHRRDFAIAARSLGRLFDHHPEPLLVIVGECDISAYPDLARHQDRIEHRRRVPLTSLFAEVARFDVNLAPLEVGNPFCEAKSAVRCHVASAVGIPTVASPTAPLQEAVLDGVTGILAPDEEAWTSAFETLLDDALVRKSMGKMAETHANTFFSHKYHSDMVAQHFSKILTIRSPQHPA